MKDLSAIGGVLLLLLILLVFVSQVSLAETNLPLTCQFDGHTKIYLKNNINDKYPREVIFQCGYNCISQNYTIQHIIAEHKMKLTSFATEAFRMVCQGVTVKKAKWGFEIDKVNSFYAHQTSTKEIKDWAVSEGRNLQIEQALAQNLILLLSDVIKGYQAAAQSQQPISESFKQSAEVLLQIKAELTLNQFHLLDKWLNYSIDSFKKDSAEYLTLIILNRHAAWRG